MSMHDIFALSLVIVSSLLAYSPQNVCLFACIISTKFQIYVFCLVFTPFSSIKYIKFLSLFGPTHFVYLWRKVSFHIWKLKCYLIAPRMCIETIHFLHNSQIAQCLLYQFCSLCKVPSEHHCGIRFFVFLVFMFYTNTMFLYRIWIWHRKTTDNSSN